MKSYKNKRNIIIMLVALIVIVIGVWAYVCTNRPERTDPYKELIEEIHSLNQKIDSLELQRDTINN